MTSDLSSFAARLRDFISRGSEDPVSAPAKTALTRNTSLEAEFNDLALALFALQFKHNAAYRKFCEARKSIPDSIKHWSQIPAIPTSAFKELDLTCLPAEERATVFHSSGTTEQRPSLHFHSAQSLAVYETSLWPWFRAHLLSDLRFTIYDLRLNGQPAEPQKKSAIGNSDKSRARAKRCRQSAIILTPPPAQAPHSSLVHMCDVVRRELGSPSAVFVGETTDDGSWALNLAAALSALQTGIENERSLILLGTAFSFVHLLDHLVGQDLRFELPTGSRVMETGGYKGRSRSLPKSELHSLITERLGIPASHIVCEYGMSELSSQAYDLEVRGARCEVSGVDRAFCFPPCVRTQIISPESGNEVAEGETGLLRIFDLANVFSAMAIQTEDLAIRRGNGFELIGRAAIAEPRGCSLMLQGS